ncbi:hypothetical protein AB6A40_001479 [Gnathostoma spinigerum]|uniref:Arrestin C-terminal-like domain-containing protein n=1 Tax=Gnathostoma spinigerum TaxID=75299 RepID=A0ABD6E599_9BILA
MVKLERFDIEFDNAECTYFAGQEVTGKVVIETCEPKKVSEILLELKGRARTHWTKHSGKSRSHCSQSEPYFCEQFNTCYTHKFSSPTKDGKGTERILPEGRHEIPFSYTLPKSLPSSFEGEFGHIRYTCRATCERPWDFDIVSKKAFTVIGIEDINENPALLEPTSASECNSSLRFCFRKQGSISAELSLDRAGFTPGENLYVNAKVQNDSQRVIKGMFLRMKQHVNYRAKTFAGSEHVKTANKVIVKKERGEVAAHCSYLWNNEKIEVPSVPPKLSRCKIIEVTYSIELEVLGVLTVAIPISICTIPRLSDFIMKAKNGNGSSSSGVVFVQDGDSVVHVTVTDERGQTIETSEDDNLTPETEAIISRRKRVRMPSSILTELYPSLPSPYYKESHFGQSDISEDKENFQFGEKLFAPKYPFYNE